MKRIDNINTATRFSRGCAVSHKTDHHLFRTHANEHWFWFIDLLNLSLHTDTLPSINQLSKSKNHGRPRKIVYFIKNRKRINRTGFFRFFLSNNINIEFQKFQKSQITTLIKIFRETDYLFYLFTRWCNLHVKRNNNKNVLFYSMQKDFIYTCVYT